MPTSCECCGVAYDKEGMNSCWISTVANISALSASGRICLYCASYIPENIVDIALGVICHDPSATWNGTNFRTHPELALRLREVQNGRHCIFKIISDTTPYYIKACPRCGTNLVEKTSESIFGEKYSVKKCNNCGYCD
jgi:hypothetical protein